MYRTREYFTCCHSRSLVAMWPQRSPWSLSKREHSSDLPNQNSGTSSTTMVVQPATVRADRHSSGTESVTRQTRSLVESNERMDEPSTRAPRNVAYASVARSGFRSHGDAGVATICPFEMESERAGTVDPSTLRSEARYVICFFCDGRSRRLMSSSVGIVRPSTPSAVRSAWSLVSAWKGAAVSSSWRTMAVGTFAQAREMLP
eukprot:scaffold9647_cov107-Isochrysis_galbana.AAC.5